MVDHAIELLLHRIARFQHGVLSTAQVLFCGVTPDQMQYRIKVGRYLRPVPGVIVISGAPDTWERMAWIALCWAGEGSALSHSAAARAHGFDGFDDSPVEISIMHHKPSRGIPFKVHRVSKHLGPEITERDGLPVTSVRRTILDLAGQKHRRVARVLHEAFRRKILDSSGGWLYVEQEWQRGRRGIAILRGELKLLTGTEHLTDSFMESVFMRKVAESGLPLPIPQFPVRLPSQQAFFDFAYPDRMFGIELDSGAWHDGPIAKGKDARRDAEARVLGWRMERFTWAQIMYDWEYVEGILRHALNLEKSPT